MAAVSVIIPTYNHSAYVCQTVESVLAQKFGDYEIIVVNDGSVDNTSTVLRPYLQAHRIRYIEQMNRGQASARNRGLAEASGEFIAFLDDDDLWPTEKLDWQVRVLGESSAVAVGGSVATICQRGTITSEYPGENAELTPTSFFRGNPFHSPGQVLMRRAAIAAIGGLDERIWGADDLDLWMRLSRRGVILQRNRLSLYYRMHPTNASRNMVRMLLNSHKVLRSNLRYLPAACRRECYLSGYRWLYCYAGRAVVRQFRAEWAHGRRTRAAELAFLVLRVFGHTAWRSPCLFRTLVSEMGIGGMKRRLLRALPDR